jgi:hypothetical protein
VPTFFTKTEFPSDANLQRLLFPNQLTMCQKSSIRNPQLTVSTRTAAFLGKQRVHDKVDTDLGIDQ